MSQEPRSEERSEGWMCLSNYYRATGSQRGPGDRAIRCGLPVHGREVDHDEMVDGEAGIVTWPWPASPPPRSWSLPPEPGPEVTRLKAKDGTEWERCGETRWDRRTSTGDLLECLTFIGVLVVHGTAVDATQDTTP